jgi:hypothetical protein
MKACCHAELCETAEGGADDQFIANTLCGKCRIVNNNFHVIVDSDVDFSETINRPANVLHIENKDFDKIDSLMATLDCQYFSNEFRNFILEYNPNSVVML